MEEVCSKQHCRNALQLFFQLLYSLAASLEKFIFPMDFIYMEIFPWIDFVGKENINLELEWKEFEAPW